jgi:hypothetical protein
MPKKLILKISSIIVSALLVCINTLHAADSVTIVAASGSIGDFKGFGCNLTGFSGNLNSTNKQTITNLVWKDLNLQICRFYRSLQRLTPATELNEFQSALLFVKVAQPNIKVLYNPTGVINGNAARWASSVATHIKYFSDQGINCDATGIGNEPNQDTSGTSNDWAARMPASLNTMIIKLLRTELNSRGLTGIKIIANESSNVDEYVWSFANAITADANALSALDYFAYHAYNMSLTHAMYTYLKPLNKGGFWQTETCSYGGNI